jgi:hypothetical protein
MSDLVPLVNALVPVRLRHAVLIDHAAGWCAALGVPADPDLFALVCAGVDPFDDEPEASPLVWTRVGVCMLLLRGIPNWCTRNRCRWPLEVVPAAWQWLDFLEQTGRLDPRSDPLWELRKPLICYGGLGFDGRPRPGEDPSPIPCECHLPYRLTAEYLNGAIRAGQLLPNVLFGPSADRAPDPVDPATLGRRWTSDPLLSGRARGRARRARSTRRPGGAGRPGW